MTIATDCGNVFGNVFVEAPRQRTLPRARTGVAHRFATRLGRRLMEWGTRVRVDLDHAEHMRIYDQVRAREAREHTAEVVARLM